MTLTASRAASGQLAFSVRQRRMSSQVAENVAVAMKLDCRSRGRDAGSEGQAGGGDVQGIGEGDRQIKDQAGTDNASFAE